MVLKYFVGLCLMGLATDACIIRPGDVPPSTSTPPAVIPSILPHNRPKPKPTPSPPNLVSQGIPSKPNIITETSGDSILPHNRPKPKLIPNHLINSIILPTD